jgi:hypothetical protein
MVTPALPRNERVGDVPLSLPSPALQTVLKKLL